MFLIRACLTAITFWLTSVGAITAQDQISPSSFLDRALGKTLSFTDLSTGALVGVEQFLRRDLSVWAETNGRCSYGRIEERGPLICFIYEQFPNPDNCWMPFDKGGQLMVMSTLSYQIQQISKISERPVQCEDAPLS
ncbi:MAG: hypothetical protein AAGA08_14160 [Pseudomonadota bacterium]